MANPKHLALLEAALRSGDRTKWNAWRSTKHESYGDGYRSLVRADLSGADLRNLYDGFGLLDLTGVNLRSAKLDWSVLSGGHLMGADLRSASLTHVDLRRAILDGADLRGADFRNACLVNASLSRVNLGGASLKGADLRGVRLIGANLRGADLTDCNVYGISAWNVDVDARTKQSRLLICNSDIDGPVVSATSLELPQFINLLQDHKRFRDMIIALVHNGVLLLGRFTDERKEILDALAQHLVKLGYVPMLFDFKQIPGRDFTETIMLLAGLARFVIADVTGPKSVPQEAQAIIPNFKIPFLPIIKRGERPWSMFKDYALLPWVMNPVHSYASKADLIKGLKGLVALAESKHQDLAKLKSRGEVGVRPI